MHFNGGIYFRTRNYLTTVERAANVNSRSLASVSKDWTGDQGNQFKHYLKVNAMGSQVCEQMHNES